MRAAGCPPSNVEFGCYGTVLGWECDEGVDKTFSFVLGTLAREVIVGPKYVVNTGGALSSFARVKEGRCAIPGITYCDKVGAAEYFQDLSVGLG